MTRYWRQILASECVLGVFATVYLLSYFAEFLVSDLDSSKVRWVLLVLACVCYGSYRVGAFHPYCNRRYRQWLEVAPWTFGKPLPVGPVQLVWVDLVIISLLCLTGHLNGVSNVLWLPVVFLSVYLVHLAATFDAKQIHFVLLFLFLAPFAVYPHRDLTGGLAVLGGLYVIVYLGYRRQFAEFPWNTKFWKSDAVAELRKEAIAQGVIGWPYRMLNAYEPCIKLDFVSALVISILATWWLHVTAWVFEEPARTGLLAGIVGMALPVLVIARLLAYVGSLWPPISLFGRIFTLRLIIPGYDKVFFGPVCALLIGTAGAFGVGKLLGLNAVWRFELSFFSVLLLILSLPPSLKKWRLLGRHRLLTLGRHARMERKRAPILRYLERFLPVDPVGAGINSKQTAMDR